MTNARKIGYGKWRKQRADDSPDIVTGSFAESNFLSLFWGDRYGMIRDPFGHRWSIASRIEDLSPRELQARASQWAKERRA